MDKNTYLQMFKDGLEIFEESYQQKKVLELDDKITEILKSQTSEEEALKGLGDVNDLIQQVYKENHVDYEKSHKKKNILFSNFEHFFEVVNHVVDVMSKNSAKANGLIILDILILIFLTCIIKIPFILVRDLGDSLFDFFASPLLINIWHLFVEIIYIVVAVTVFLNIFKKWFENLKVHRK